MEPVDTDETLRMRRAPAGGVAPGGDGPTQPLPPADGRRRPSTPAGPHDAAPARPDAPPRLAEGVELLGRMEDSGYKEPPFMARRADGQMIQLAPILYLVAERAEGRRSYDQIGAEVSQMIGRGLDGDAVRMLAEEKLRPLGVLAAADGSSPEVQKADPLLGLKLKTAVIPPRAVRAITTIFRPFFLPPVILLVLAAFIAFDVWFFFDHGVAQSVRQLLYQPLYLILTFAFVVLAAALHETGHATGCRYGGAEPGAMGAGIYIVWPAFYTDVTDSYRLRKGGRLRTDLGGVYFNAIFILAMAGAYFATRFEPLLIPILVAHLEIFRQLLPLLRLDGYHVLADLTGVPDLFARIKPILVSLVPGKKSDERVTQLKPWVRVVVTLWVLVFVAFLAVNLAYILAFAPRIFATGWDSFWQHLDGTRAAFGQGDTMGGVAGVIRLLALALPAIGIAFGLTRTGGRVTRKLWTGTRGRPLARFAGSLLLVGAVAGVALLWWPDGDYVPIQPGERWTATDAAAAVSTTAAGEPAFATVVAEGTGASETDLPADDVSDEGPVGGVSSPSAEDDVVDEPLTETTTEPETETTTEPTLEPTSEPTSEPSPVVTESP